jgi:(p)ppGpp synthase/HD superfamily hydrolase
MTIDYESSDVYRLVLEVTRGTSEKKSDFLIRIFKEGSNNAKVLKVADRISNMISLGFVNKPEFVERYTRETVDYIFPIAEQIDILMLKELQALVESRRTYSEIFAKKV